MDCMLPSFHVNINTVNSAFTQTYFNTALLSYRLMISVGIITCQ